MTPLEAMRDQQLFAPHFPGESWNSWEALVALLSNSIGDRNAELIRRCTGRKIAASITWRELWLIIGRRGGKTRIAAFLALYIACFRDYRAVLAPGEMGTLALIAADRRQSRTLMRYVNGFIDSIPMLARMVVARTKESIEFDNRVIIEIHTASFRSTRGYTLIGAICDEIAFWQTDDASANPDREILAGLRPGMATVPGALLICLTSPYARRGATWETYKKHFGQDGDPVLVWQADTRTMNPAVDEQIIAQAYQDDEASAAAEYGAEFRRDVEAFVSREIVDAVIVPGRRELPPMRDTRYHAFVDPSGGSQDSMTLAVAHKDWSGKMVLDCVREVRPPFSPDQVAAEFAETVKHYGLSSVTGDRYAGEWPRERLRKHNVQYQIADKPKSDLYRDLLPHLTAGTVALLDHPRLIQQLCGLERRTARGGRDSIDHGPRGHDDVANCVAGVFSTIAVRRESGVFRILGA